MYILYLFRKYVLCFVFILLPISLIGQISFSKLSMGFGMGITIPEADTPRQDIGLAYDIQFNYHLNAFMNLSLEYEFGTLQANPLTIESDPLQRSFINSFSTFNVNYKLQIGNFFPHYGNKSFQWLKRIHLGLGIGSITNNITKIERGENLNLTATDKHKLEGRNSSSDLIVLTNLGITFPLYESPNFKTIKLVFNTKATFTLGEGLDGYNSAYLVNLFGQPTKNDLYYNFSLTLLYGFGGLGYTYKRRTR